MREVTKRDGQIVAFDKSKITSAIQKAIDAADEQADAKQLTSEVMDVLGRKKLHVELIQDTIEQVLVKRNLYKVAKAFILYRKQRAEVRRTAHSLGILDDFHLPLNALQVLASRYLRRSEYGQFSETPKQMYERVANAIAQVDKLYGHTEEQVQCITLDFYNAMVNNEFLPNSPTLMNAGTPLGQLSACFVLPVNDSIEEIFNAIKWTAMIHRSGGGTGFSFSRLRPTGDYVSSTGGAASGPVSFMKVFNSATEIVKQGGKRRGANIGTLRVDHPDILDFITAKASEGELANFNISVGATDSFMEAVQHDSSIDLVNPRTQRPTRTIRAKAIWDLVMAEAWKTGEPGMLFLDTINASSSNCIPKYGPIESTNPCGEICLYPFEACNLGSINLSKCVKNGHIDTVKLERLTKLAVHFLDNVIDANKYPILQIERAVKRGRRIGLGIMGFADMLILLKVPYDTIEALDVARQVMALIEKVAHEESKALGSTRGSFPEFEDSIWPKRGYKNLRNCCVTSIAPTGTISIIAGGCSSGIEPLYSVAYVRQVGESLGTSLFEVSPLFEQTMVREGLYTEELIEKVSKKTSIQNVEEIPMELRRLFVTAHNIEWKQHVMMQAEFQRHVDNSISKTINFPETATPRDIEDAYMFAWKTGCKGITVYRDKCRVKQVLCPRCSE